jgi:DNA gyrase/topoisomerase IV subunit B
VINIFQSTTGAMFFGSLKSDVLRRHVANSRFNKRKYGSASGLNGRGITVVQAFGHETGYCDGVNPAMGTTTHAREFDKSVLHKHVT